MCSHSFTKENIATRAFLMDSYGVPSLRTMMLTGCMESVKVSFTSKKYSKLTVTMSMVCLARQHLLCADTRAFSLTLLLLLLSSAVVA